jgi:ABC-type multidrug transport system fused ATPase/permease subunit
MERNLFKFILNFSKRQQLVVLALAAISYPIILITLELPKAIVDEAIGGNTRWASDLFGIQQGAEADERIPFLLILCFGFLFFVVLSGGVKYVLNVYAGRMGELMLRRLRYMLYCRVLRFPQPHFKKVSQGEIIPMITAEVEPLGGFIGAAIQIPAYQGGMLLVYLAFIFMQDVFLGLAAISLYPVQLYVIPKMQARVVALAKRRVREVRQLSDKVGESIGGVTEVHAHDTSAYERADVSRRLDRIYKIRFTIFKWKFAIKFLNNFLAQLTPFFFYAIGGYFVITGEITIGALVAVLAAYKDLNSPWKELLNYYQLQADVRVKYEQVVDQFDPPGMLDEAIQDSDEVGPDDVKGDLQAANVTYSEDGRSKTVEGVNFSIDLDKHVAVAGGGGSGKDDLSLLLSRILMPTGGTLSLSGDRMDQLPEAFTGRRLAYMSASPFFFATTVRENLYYGLKHRPLGEPDYDEAGKKERSRYIADATSSGNTDRDPFADWVDYQAAGVDDEKALDHRAIEVVRIVDMADDMYQLGLRGSIDPVARPELAADILKARIALRQRLEDTDQSELVEAFDRGKYTENATLGENLLFGTPRDSTFNVDLLAEHEYVRRIIREADLNDDLVITGRQLAETMIEIFSGLPAGHEFFEQYSFIGSDELPDYQQLVARTATQEPSDMRPEDRLKLRSLVLKLTPARHRLGLITDEIRAKVLNARKLFADHLPENLKDAVEFFDPESYNGAAALQDNILFGKVAYGQAQAAIKLSNLMGEVLDELELRDTVMLVGLDYHVGVGGARLSAAQRQKLGLARCILKKPEVLVINEGITNLDGASQRRVLESLLEDFKGRGVIWTLHRSALADHFDQVLVMKSGKVVENGTFDELNNDGALLKELIESE